MNKTIEEIIEVIEEVRDKFQNQTGYRDIRRIRISAVTSVAYRRGINFRTVSDKFQRGLKRYTKGTPAFDKLLEGWLVQDSDELKNILLEHRGSRLDIERINNAFYKAPEEDVLLAQEFGYDPNEEPFKEGKVQFKLHRIKERNRFLVNRAKKIWAREQDGRVRCSICSFSFSETYGSVGEGFIEAHHTQPISSLAPDTNVSPADLVPVCSNCHSMLHRHRPRLTVEQLRTIFRAKGIAHNKGVRS